MICIPLVVSPPSKQVPLVFDSDLKNVSITCWEGGGTREMLPHLR